MAERTALVGRYRIANDSSIRKRMESLGGDPRLQFYEALVATDSYDAYAKAVGQIKVTVPSFNGPISGRDEILYARRSGWIADADTKPQDKPSRAIVNVTAGFKVEKRAHALQPPQYERGRIYNRRKDIHAVYGGQQQGGIATPTGPFIFLFTGQQGAAYGYQDGMRADGIFEYTGECQAGETGFVRGNKAIRDHAANGKDLLLFETLKTKGQCRYIGSFVCDGWTTRNSTDKNKTSRNVIVFDLIPIENVDTNQSETSDAATSKASLEDLRRQAYASAATPDGEQGKQKRNIYARSRDVRNYVLARAKGTCESCRTPAPFMRSNGTPYLEPHHTRRLSDGGPDHPRWVGAICPTCHRCIHHGAGGMQVNEALMVYLGDVEGTAP